MQTENTHDGEPQEDERRFLIEQIQRLQREYEKAAEPFVKRLVEIESLRPPAPVIITVEQAKELFQSSDAVQSAA